MCVLPHVCFLALPTLPGVLGPCTPLQVTVLGLPFCKHPRSVSQPLLLGRSSTELMALPVAYGGEGGVQGDPKFSPLLLPSRLGKARSCASPGPCWSLPAALGWVSPGAGSLCRQHVSHPRHVVGLGAEQMARLSAGVLLPELMSSTWWLPRPHLKVSLSLGKPGAGGLGGARRVLRSKAVGFAQQGSRLRSRELGTASTSMQRICIGIASLGFGCGIEACPSTELCPARLHVHPSSVGTCLSPGCPALRGSRDPAAREFHLAPSAGPAVLAMAPSTLVVFGWSTGSNCVAWVALQAG